MIDWTLKNIQSNVDFIASCLMARQNHPDLNKIIIDLLYEVANIGRSRQKRASQEQSYLVDLFSRILPCYFSPLNYHEYFELMDELIGSHHFQFEKDRPDKQHLLYDIIDSCLHQLSQ